MHQHELSQWLSELPKQHQWSPQILQPLFEQHMSGPSCGGGASQRAPVHGPGYVIPRTVYIDEAPHLAGRVSYAAASADGGYSQVPRRAGAVKRGAEGGGLHGGRALAVVGWRCTSGRIGRIERGGRRWRGADVADGARGGAECGGGAWLGGCCREEAGGIRR
jgi:hypothetical protein